MKKRQPKRKINEPTIYQKCKNALSNTTKTELVFRDNKIKEIENFVQTHLKKQTSSSIYISGPPGTGKTATVNFILDKLEEKYEFKRTILNGMAYPTATGFYKKILFDLTGKNSRSKDLVPLIIEELSDPDADMFILTLDEIDSLNDDHQEMLYTIFGLAMNKSTKIIIIGIANSLDFTDKYLKRFHTLKVQKIKEVTFQPYDYTKIAGIIKNRISDLPVEELFQKGAIEFCARKVASLSGDARKALEIMRRSVELVEQETNELKPLKEKQNKQDENKKNVILVTNSHIIKILKQVFDEKIVEIEDDEYSFPIQQKLVLCTILLFHKEGIKNPELGKCFDRLLKINKEKSLNLEISSANTFLDMCEMLEAKSLINIQRSKDLRCSKLSIKLSLDEAKELLKTNVTLNSILG